MEDHKVEQVRRALIDVLMDNNVKPSDAITIMIDTLNGIILSTAKGKQGYEKAMELTILNIYSMMQQSLESYDGMISAMDAMEKLNEIVAKRGRV